MYQMSISNDLDLGLVVAGGCYEGVSSLSRLCGQSKEAFV